MYSLMKIAPHSTQPDRKRPRSKVELPYLLCRALAILGIGSALALNINQSAFAQERKISAEAVQQMRVLLDEKAARTSSQRKISSSLLLTAMKKRDAAMMSALPALRTSVELAEDDTTLVDIRTAGPEALEQIKTLGGTVINSVPRYRAIRARIPIDRLEELAESSSVVSIRPADQYQIHQIDTSEGDHAHGADSARSTFGVDGTGVRVGVISDSIEALASLQGSDDLPDVTVLPGQSGSGTSEGTALLEIVHDLAPAAELFFATAIGGQAQFAQNILDLRAAGCDVIVDDVGYFAEPVFQDDIIAQAVDAVVGDGAQYYSSAGNSGNLNDGTAGVWEGDFVPTPAPSVVAGQGDAHDFGGGSNFNLITKDSPSVFTLQWSDPQGNSGNDYDLFLLTPDLSAVIDFSTNIQAGDDDPFEIINSVPFDDTNTVLVIIRKPGAEGRFLHLNTNRGQLDLATAGQTSGHSAAVGAFSVAAVDVATAGADVFTGGAANPVESFSSDGPRQIFYEPDGTPISPGDFSSTGGTLRQKPDIAAADGVSTATPGFKPFFGTSASAPHAAAIGALLLDNSSAITPDTVRAIFNETALDIEAPGVDRDSGVGIVMADRALGAPEEQTAVVFKYAAKLICGLQDDPQNMRLSQGFYATAINIHNPNPSEVRFSKKLALTFPPDGQRPGEVIRISEDVLGEDQALEVDCIDIQQRVFPNGFPTPYIKGFVTVTSEKSLDVTAVYTSRSIDRGDQAQQASDYPCCPRDEKPSDECCVSHSVGSSSIDVEQIKERRMEVQPGAGEQLPDLIPVPPEESVTTGEVFCTREDNKLVVSVGNQGSAQAGSSTTEVDFFEFGRSTATVSPLNSGEQQQLLLEIPQGCYDPIVCEFRIAVDSGREIAEGSETNNMAAGNCRTLL